MDMLSWILLIWLAVAAVAFLVLQKAIDRWPLSESSPKAAPVPSATPVESVSAAVEEPLLRASTATANFASGAPQSVPQTSSAPSDQQWLNDFIAWLFEHYKGVPEWARLWLRSLNDAAKKVTLPTNCEILFEEISRTGAEPPKIENVRSERGPRDQMTLRGTVKVPELGLHLVSSQRMTDRLLVTNYDAVIHNLTGQAQLRIACIANELFLMACFDGRPEMSIDLRNTDPSALGGQVDPAAVDDAIRKCLVAAVTNLTLGANSTDTSSPPPEDVGSGLSQPLRLSKFAQPVEEVFKRLNVPAAEKAVGMEREASTQLLVKVIRAQKLGRGEPVSRPFVNIEMDEPAQKFCTTKGLNVSPYWEEEFNFAINPRSEEILFEIYDQEADDKEREFLGLAIISLEELRHSNDTLHTLTLQARPYQQDRVSGTLQVEFTFLQNGSAPIGKTVIVRQEESNEGLISETVEASRRPISLDGSAPVPTKTTTVMVKSVSQAQPGTSDQPPEIIDDDPTPRAPEPLSFEPPQREPVAQVQHKPPAAAASPPPVIQVTTSEPVTPVHTQNNQRQSRPEKRSFFGELKRKMSLSRSRKKKRPHSASVGEAVPVDGRWQSASQPPSRDVSESRYSTSVRSAADTVSGDISVVSSTSIYQRSTLVVEMEKNNICKYYLIPPNMVTNAQALKLMKRGKKLHIFNEHTFVAVRIRGGTVCNICGRSVNRSLAKQAYQCRDCRLLCHKGCHFKTDTFCPSSNVPNLQM